MVFCDVVPPILCDFPCPPLVMVAVECGLEARLGVEFLESPCWPNQTLARRGVPPDPGLPHGAPLPVGFFSTRPCTCKRLQPLLVRGAAAGSPRWRSQRRRLCCSVCTAGVSPRQPSTGEGALRALAPADEEGPPACRLARGFRAPWPPQRDAPALTNLPRGTAQAPSPPTAAVASHRSSPLTAALVHRRTLLVRSTGPASAGVSSTQLMTEQCLKRAAADIHERLSELHTRFQATGTEVRRQSGRGGRRGVPTVGARSRPARRSPASNSLGRLAQVTRVPAQAHSLLPALQTSQAEEWHTLWAEQVRPGFVAAAPG